MQSTKPTQVIKTKKFSFRYQPQDERGDQNHEKHLGVLTIKNNKKTKTLYFNEKIKL